VASTPRGRLEAVDEDAVVVGGAGHVDIGHGGTLPIVPVPLATVQVWPAGRLCTVTS
jgi:hypothetical protein